VCSRVNVLNVGVLLVRAEPSGIVGQKSPLVLVPE
jgi:hypothetical protein